MDVNFKNGEINLMCCHFEMKTKIVQIKVVQFNVNEVIIFYLTVVKFLFLFLQPLNAAH